MSSLSWVSGYVSSARVRSLRVVGHLTAAMVTARECECRRFLCAQFLGFLGLSLDKKEGEPTGGRHVPQLQLPAADALRPGSGLCYPVNRKIFTSTSEIIASAKTVCMTR